MGLTRLPLPGRGSILPLGLPRRGSLLPVPLRHLQPTVLDLALATAPSITLDADVSVEIAASPDSLADDGLAAGGEEEGGEVSEYLPAHGVDAVCAMLMAVFDEWVLSANLQSRGSDGLIRERNPSPEAVRAMWDARDGLDAVQADPGDVISIKLASQVTGRSPEQIVEGLRSQLLPLDAVGLPIKGVKLQPARQGTDECSACKTPLVLDEERRDGLCLLCGEQGKRLHKKARHRQGTDYYEEA